MEKGSILLVAGQPGVVSDLRSALGGFGYTLRAVRTLGRAVSALRPAWPDVVLLDFSGSFQGALETLRRLRRAGCDLPVLGLAREGAVRDRVAALENGADDFLSAPWVREELLARVRALLRRARGSLSARRVIRFGGVEVDLAARTVRREGRPVHLTPREFSLLACLVQNPGRAQSRQRLLDLAWGPTYEGTLRTVDNFIARLRAKFEPRPEAPVHFITVRSTGYRFEPSLA